MSRSTAFVCASLLLAGCTTDPVLVHEDTSAKAIAASAAQIQATWNVLGGIERAQHPEYQRLIDESGPGFYPGALQKKITVSWNGPIEPLLDTLAREAHITSSRVGVPPPTPILVYVKADNAAIGDVLRDVGYQAGNRAGIRIVPGVGTERVELVYVPR